MEFRLQPVQKRLNSPTPTGSLKAEPETTPNQRGWIWFVRGWYKWLCIFVRFISSWNRRRAAECGL